MAASSAASRSSVGASRKRNWRPPWWVQVSLGLLVLLSIWFVVVPQLSDGQRSLNALRGVSIPLVVLALFLEALSLLSYSLMTALIFPRGTIRFFTLLRIDLTSLGASRVLPAGGATSTALRVRLLHLAGAGSQAALTAAAVQATASYLVLGCLLVMGVVLSISSGGGMTAVGLGVIIAVLLIAGTVLGLVQLGRRPERPVRLARAVARRIRVREETAAAVVRGLSGRVHDLLHHPRRMSRVLLFAALHWLLDAAVLWVMLAAVGQPLSVGPVLLIYGLGGVVAILPLTPNGLGIVEGAILPALVAFDVPPPAALFAVLGWRLLQYWLPIPVAGLTYAWLRLGPLRGRH